MKNNFAIYPCLAIYVCLYALAADSTPCISNGVLDIVRFPCSSSQRRRFLFAEDHNVNHTRSFIARVGSSLQGLLTSLTNNYRSRHFIPEAIIQRTAAVPTFEDPNVTSDLADLYPIGHALQVYFAEFQAMESREMRLKLNLLEKPTYEGTIRICLQTIRTSLCRMDNQLRQAGYQGFRDTTRSSLNVATCLPDRMTDYMARSIHSLENIKEYFRLLAML